MKYVEKAVPKKTLSPDVNCVWYARDFCFSDGFNISFEAV